MFIRKATQAAILFLLLIWRQGAAAQPAQLGYHVIIPTEPIPYQELGNTASQTEFLRLRWNFRGRLERNPNQDLQPGVRVEKRGRIGSGTGTEITYPYTLQASDTLVRADTFVSVPLGGRATIYPDKNDGSRLHVNFWLFKNPVPYTDSAGETRMISPDSLRKIEFYYRLENRQSVVFPYRSVSVGAVTIPFRYRFGYTAENGREISPSFTAGPSAAVFVGHTRGSVRYTYLRHTENSIERRRSVTAGGFLGLAAVEVDSTNSKSANTPVASKTSIAVVSPGAMVMLGVKGVEAGLFVGVDLGTGDIGRRWDYDGKVWAGIGVGFNLWSLLK